MIVCDLGGSGGGVSALALYLEFVVGVDEIGSFRDAGVSGLVGAVALRLFLMTGVLLGLLVVLALVCGVVTGVASFLRLQGAGLSSLPRFLFLELRLWLQR